MNLKILSILLKITTILHLAPSATSLDRKCSELFYNYVHPYYCCEYPVADTKVTSSDHCYHECTGSVNFCCIYNCIHNEFRMFNNGMITVEERLSHYESDYQNKKGMKEIWDMAVKKSVDTCESLSKFNVIIKEWILNYIWGRFLGVFGVPYPTLGTPLFGVTLHTLEVLLPILGYL